jgi:hypothetical protein
MNANETSQTAESDSRRIEAPIDIALMSQNLADRLIDYCSHRRITATVSRDKTAPVQ